MDQVRQGDRDAFDRLCQRYDQQVTAFFAQRISCGARVDDLKQELFLRVWDERERYRSGTKDLSYLMGFARFIVLEHYTSQYIQAEAESKIEIANKDHQSSREIAEEYGILHSWIVALPLKQRQAVQLKYFQGFSTQEIANRLSCAESTVREHLYLGLSKLRARITTGGTVFECK